VHFRLPKPLHGWREFAGEVGIIVVGVLIALGAEQVVETIHSRAAVSEFRHATDAELGWDLAAYHYRLGQSPCVEKRLSDLARWHDAAPETILFQREIGRPSLISFGSSVWNSRGDAVEKMPLRTRIAYSAIYDELNDIQTTVDAERDVWRSLAAFNGAPPLGPDAKMRLNELLYRARTLDWVIQASRREFLNRAAKLHIVPSFGEEAQYLMPPDKSFCAPLIAPTHGVKAR
jgi:hypothetical protein